MTNHLSAEELQAILEHAESDRRVRGAVAVRDFKRPLRLSQSALVRCRRTAQKALPEIAAALRKWLRREVEVDVVSIAEIDAHELVAGWKNPVCVLCFESENLPGWLVWDGNAAVAAAEIALGANEVRDPSARPLSPAESSILAELLGSIAASTSFAFGITIANPRVVEDVDDYGPLDDLPRNADARRLSIEIALAGTGVESRLRLHLPGVAVPGDEPAAPSREKSLVDLPSRLGAIEVEVGARLGSAEVPLSELLALEVGDVLVLGAQSGGSLDLVVEGEPCARARFGTHAGKLAVRIETTGVELARQKT